MAFERNRGGGGPRRPRWPQEPPAPYPTPEPEPQQSHPGSGPAPGPAPGPEPPAPPAPGPVDSSTPPQPRPPIDASPAPGRQPLPSTTTNPLVEEGVQVSDPTGVSTFARPGARSFQPFQGRVLAQKLRDPSQQFGLQAHDLNAASRRGDIGRTTALGQGGSLGSALGSAGGRNRLEDEVLRRFGLAG